MTRYLTIAALLCACVLPAYAAPMPPEVCTKWGETAAKIMKLRQVEAPMSEQMAAAGKGIDDPTFVTMVRGIVMEAYKEPAYRTEENQANAVAEFRNRVELACFQLE